MRIPKQWHLKMKSKEKFFTALVARRLNYILPAVVRRVLSGRTIGQAGRA
jgi:hypothetical protein